jgi:hypothetical protein
MVNDLGGVDLIGLDEAVPQVEQVSFKTIWCNLVSPPAGSLSAERRVEVEIRFQIRIGTIDPAFDTTVDALPQVAKRFPVRRTIPCFGEVRRPAIEVVELRKFVRGEIEY